MVKGIIKQAEILGRFLEADSTGTAFFYRRAAGILRGFFQEKGHCGCLVPVFFR